MFFLQILLVTGLKTVFDIQQQDLSLSCGPSTPKINQNMLHSFHIIALTHTQTESMA